LKSLDRDGRVLYAGTFSKVLFPALRLGYLVVPEAQIERFEQVSPTFASTPQLTQAIVTAFITEGHFSRHIQRMRKLYAERRRASSNGLMAALGEHIRIDPKPGGMHLILRLRDHVDDRALVAEMLRHGLYGEALTAWTSTGQGPSALLVNFTNIQSHDEAEGLGRRIRALL